MHFNNIPPQAKNIHSWPSFEIYQRQQKLFDGNHKTYEMARMSDSVKVVLVDRNNQKIIMINDEQPDSIRLTFAGGLVEKDEDMLQAAKREVSEETWYHYQSLYTRFKLPYANRVSGHTQYYIAWDLEQKYIAKPDTWSEKITLLPMNFETFIDHITDPHNHSDFSYYICKQYLLTNKINDLKFLLFWS